MVGLRKQDAGRASGVDRTAHAIRRRLVEIGGRTSQDLGFGRIVGQVLVYLYFWNGDCSLDQIGEELGLSKAAISIAARQLESLGLIQRTGRRGDRRHYYQTVANIGTALQAGVLRLVRNKLAVTGVALEDVTRQLCQEVRDGGAGSSADVQFLCARIRRSQELHRRFTTLLSNPLVRFLVPEKKHA